MAVWEIWADTGGTFTDCLAKNPLGEITRVKVLSSGVLKGTVIEGSLNQLKIDINWIHQPDIFEDYFLECQDYSYQVQSTDLKKGVVVLTEPIRTNEFPQIFTLHANEEPPVLGARILTRTKLSEEFPSLQMKLGSTKGTNALLEGKGNQPILIVTKGFNDLLRIGNQQRPDLFALNVVSKKYLFKETLEAKERIDTSGAVIQSIDNIDELVRECGEDKSQSIAIALLNAYQNPTHEETLKQAFKDAGFLNVTTSTEISTDIKYLPKAESSVVNAYLDEIIKNYLDQVNAPLKGGELQVMSSAGILKPYNDFLPVDSLLSGPAGGVIGAAKVAKEMSSDRILTLDMGGTSTDVAHYNQQVDYQYQVKVGDAEIMTPSIKIETVAAGGGSICAFDGFKLTVGPESAGANPGPACYGAGGPLTITDVNLLLGRLNDSDFGIPINKKKAKERLSEIQKDVKTMSAEEILEGFLLIANEKMSAAVEKISVEQGYDPSEYALLGFGGAGGLHVCDIAEILNINEVLIPYDAGILSAYGIGHAESDKMLSKAFLQPYLSVENEVVHWVKKQTIELQQTLSLEGVKESSLKAVKFYLRFLGQDQSIEVSTLSFDKVLEQFKNEYQRIFGHWVEGQIIELESVKVIVGSSGSEGCKESSVSKKQLITSESTHRAFINNLWEDVAVFKVSDRKAGEEIQGPCILTNTTSASYVPENWQGVFDEQRNLKLSFAQNTSVERKIDQPEALSLELFTNRFKGLADKMGALLERTSFSVNVKDRLDYSCALLDSIGNLIVNAPHIPVHLGALGYCVKRLIETIEIEEGDVIITNHPGYGGSHLPDITLVAPVYYNGQRIGFVANRAHHSEVGGMLPGSMPPNARNLVEEGVIIRPFHLVKKGNANWEGIKEIFTSGKYPTRSINENIADLNAGLASLEVGKQELQAYCQKFGVESVVGNMQQIYQQASEYLAKVLNDIPDQVFKAEEFLDDGWVIKVEVDKQKGRLSFDFEGTSAVHPNNLNATPAIIHSAVLYVLRLLVKENLPLNDGLLDKVEIKLPTCFLNPNFVEDENLNPAVVGGNTETSQRVVDTLIKALGLAACSQGTMNNFLFGNENFGYYETICGGTGAGQGFHGAHAVHQHMTNTRITDPEILEHRYPVRLEEFSIRENSGGKGEWNGGNGCVRRIKFLEAVDLTIVSQHRKEQPYGLNGGEKGKCGQQKVVFPDGKEQDLKGIDTLAIPANTVFEIQTPGGGGCGELIK